MEPRPDFEAPFSSPPSVDVTPVLDITQDALEAAGNHSEVVSSSDQVSTPPQAWISLEEIEEATSVMQTETSESAVTPDPTKEESIVWLSSDHEEPVATPALKNRKRKRLTAKAQLVRDSRIAELWEAGSTRQEIGAEVNCSYETTCRTLHRLVNEGKIDVQQYTERNVLVQRLRERDQARLPVLMQDRTLGEIGEDLGVTRERVRQLRRRLLAQLDDTETVRQGDANGERLYTTVEAANIVGMPKQWVLKQIWDGHLGTVQRRGKRHYRLTEAQLQQLRSQEKTQHEGTEISGQCSQCGEAFSYTRSLRSSKRPPRQACPKTQCANAARYQEHKVETRKRRKEWIQVVTERIQTAQTLPDEHWLTESKAVQRAGISPMQLSWLTLTGGLTIKAHPTKRWRGKPVRLYAASQLDTIRTVLTEFEAVRQSLRRP